MDPSLVDLRGLGDDVRYRIFDYLWERGVRSSDLGIDPTYANKVRNRRVRVSDTLLERMLRMLSVGEFASLVSSSQAVDQALQQVAWEPRSLGEAAIALDQYIRGIEAVIERYPQLSSVAIQRISEVLRRRAGIPIASIAINSEPPSSWTPLPQLPRAIYIPPATMAENPRI